MTKLIFLLTILWFVEAEPHNRIISGEKAKIGQFPYQASVRRSRDRQHFCGSAIISLNSVLTAANCTQGPFASPSNVVVFVGTNVLASNVGREHAVERIINHPAFNQNTMANDVSVIRLTSDILITRYTQVIAITPIRAPDKITATISGWGQFQVSLFIRI